MQSVIANPKSPVKPVKIEEVKPAEGEAKPAPTEEEADTGRIIDAILKHKDPEVQAMIDQLK